MNRVSRRDLLGMMGTGLGTVGLAGLLQAAAPPAGGHPRPRARHVIHLFMNGGPSHLDTFDPKPALTKWAGKRPPSANLSTERRTFNLFPSPYAFRPRGKSGIEISDLFPKVSECADDLCVVRSMHTDIPNHEPGMLMMCTGSSLPIRPAFGSWLLYGLGSENRNLPGFIVLCPGRQAVVGPQLWGNSFLPGAYQGCHVVNRGMKPGSVIAHLKHPTLPRAAQREQLDLLQEMNRAHLATRAGDAALEARIQSMETAFGMQVEAAEAFDLSRETTKTREAYGRGDFNDGCLLARRLVERGVRVIQLYFDATTNWDSHDDTRHTAQCAARVDRPIAALLKDLKARGLLDETLVVWGGEFGRTPVAEGTSTGRDHNHYGFSVWLAGGGVKGGMTYGATDEFGFTAVEDRMHVHDLHATMLHLMGIDHEKLTYRYSGRDFRLTDVHGKVVRAILA